MLLHAPNWLFIYPGTVIVVLAFFLGLLLLRGPVQIGSANLDVHSLVTMSFLVILGIQTIFAGLFVKLYAHVVGILPSTSQFTERLKRFSLERFLVFFVFLGITGLALFIASFMGWYSAGFSDLDTRTTMRHVIPALTLLTISGQGIFNCFMFSVLFLKTKTQYETAIKDEVE
jgi:hypothetical protein